MSWSPQSNVYRLALDGFVEDNHTREWEDEFTSLVTRQSRFVFRLAYAILRNAHDAEDVVQEIFLKLYRTGAWKTMGDERAFLARMSCRMAVENRAAKVKTVVPVEDFHSVADNPERQAVKADTERLIHNLIDSLPEELRIPLALSTLEELTSAEVGRLMNISEGTVRSRTARARQILREKLQQVLGVRHGREE